MTLTDEHLQSLLKNKASSREVLAHIRHQKLLNPVLTLSLIKGSYLKYSSPPLNHDVEEYFAILEQGCVASLHVGDIETFNKCHSILFGLIPNPDKSSRLAVLEAMRCELDGNLYDSEKKVTGFDNAIRVYKELLNVNPCNALAAKRLYCIEKTRAKNPADSIKVLVDYINTNPADMSAWFELAERYEQLGDWQAAAFCLEELVLFNPRDYLVHRMLGEVYYTMSGNVTANEVMGVDVSGLSLSSSSSSSAVSSPPSSPSVPPPHSSSSVVRPPAPPQTCNAGYALQARLHFSESLNLKGGDARSLLGLALASGASLVDCLHARQSASSSNNRGGDYGKTVVRDGDTDGAVAMALHDFACEGFKELEKDGEKAKKGTGKLYGKLKTAMGEEAIMLRKAAEDLAFVNEKAE